MTMTSVPQYIIIIIIIMIICRAWMGVHSPSCGVIRMLGHGSTTVLLVACGSSSHPNGMQKITGYHHQGFGIQRRGVEVCGCGVDAAVTLILLV